MLVTMSHTTRNAPFGTDDTPNLQMKIIGGKRVQIPIDPTQENNKSAAGYQQHWYSPHPGPHGTPSMLTQPDWEAYDSGLQSGFSTSQQHTLARKVSSYTSPMGDRSHSFKHGIPSLNTKAILPPIASQPSGSFPYQQEFNFEPARKVTQASLEDQVARQMKSFGSQKLKDMYIDLTTFDRQLTGLIGEAQFSLVALRHDLPLKLALLKIIFAKFVDVRDPSMVNYENILQFLSDCASRSTNLEPSAKQFNDFEDYRTKTSPPDLSPRESIGGLHNDFTRSYHETKDPVFITQKQVEGHTSSLRREEEDKLIGLITAQLSPLENLDLKELRHSLVELDRLNTGELPIHVVNTVCVKCRLPLTSSLITKLLGRAETTGGMVDWRSFMEPLQVVQKLRRGTSDRHTDKQETSSLYPDSAHSPFPPKPSADASPFLKTGIAESPVPKRLPWEKRPLGKIGSEFSAPSHRKSVDRESLPPSPASSASSDDQLRVNLPEGWDEREPLDRDDMYVSPRRTEPWLAKFNRLAHALRTYHPQNSKILARDEAERVTKNYNLIYGLGFSEKKIENAVHQSLLPRKDDSPGQRISIDALLELLEGKRRFLM